MLYGTLQKFTLTPIGILTTFMDMLADAIREEPEFAEADYGPDPQLGTPGALGQEVEENLEHIIRQSVRHAAQVVLEDAEAPSTSAPAPSQQRRRGRPPGSHDRVPRKCQRRSAESAAAAEPSKRETKRRRPGPGPATCCCWRGAGWRRAGLRRSWRRGRQGARACLRGWWRGRRGL